MEFAIWFVLTLLVFVGMDRAVGLLRGHAGPPLPLWFSIALWAAASTIGLIFYVAGWVSLSYLLAVSLAWAVAELIDRRHRTSAHKQTLPPKQPSAHVRRE